MTAGSGQHEMQSKIEEPSEPRSRAGCWPKLRSLLGIHLLVLIGVLLVWVVASSLGRGGETALPEPPPETSVIFREERSLEAGEYQATFRLALAGVPEDFRQNAVELGAAQIAIEAADAILVPAQLLGRKDFAFSGAYQDYSATFYVEDAIADVAFEVAQVGDVALQIDGFDVVEAGQPPTRILLLAGRGADTSGWRTWAEHGSVNHGLVDGGQHFLAYLVETLPCGSLADRTKVLAETINGLHVPDGSLKAIGHSAGGLDLRLLVSLAHEEKEPYLSAARKLQKVYTVGTPHEGTPIATWGQSILAKPFSGFLCIGEPLVDDTTPDAMKRFNEEYTWDRFEIDGRRVPFLAFSFQATCLPWWADPFGIVGRNSDGAVPLTSQSWGEPDNAPPDLPWVAAHSPPLDLGDCVAERVFMDVLNWVLADPVAAR